MGRFVVLIFLVFGLAGKSLAHPTDLNDRVTFFVTTVEQTQFQGESALALTAVLDNGLRNRLTLRDLTSTAGGKTQIFAIRKVYGIETLSQRRTFALRSGEGVEFAPPDLVIVISDLNTLGTFRKPFDLELTFQRSVGTLRVPVTFLVNEDLEHGRAVLDLGPPEALKRAQEPVEWLTVDDL